MPKCTYKISIIGAGKVGMTAAYALLLDGSTTDIVLVSRDLEKVKGAVLDLEHSLPFLQNTNLVGTDSYDQIAGSQLVVVTAGVAQQVGESRLDLVEKNAAIIREIIPKIIQAAPNAVILIVANPVDILTQIAVNIAGVRDGQIFGTGTMLDTARFRYHISEFLNISPRSIHTYILGEHGDSAFPVLSSASVGGQPLSSFPDYSKEKALQAFQKTKDAAAIIIKAEGATYYAIATVILKVSHCVFKDTKTVLPASAPLHDFYGHSGVSLSIPCIIGAGGIEKKLSIVLDNEEQQALARSVETLKQYL